MIVIGDGESPEKLATELRACYIKPYTRAEKACKGSTPIVCWGWTPASLDWLRHKPLSKVLNRRIVFNKLEQLRRFHNTGLGAPLIFDPQYEPYPENIRWLGRRLSHAKGEDIRGPFSTSEMRRELARGNSDFGTQLIDKKREFRVHIFLGKSIHMCEKVPDSAADRESIVWGNNQCSWKYVWDKDERWIQSTRQLARDAVKVLDMDFGGVDIIEDSGGYKYVLEVNSAPWLYKNTLAAYTEAIQAWATR